MEVSEGLDLWDGFTGTPDFPCVSANFFSQTDVTQSYSLYIKTEMKIKNENLKNKFFTNFFMKFQSYSSTLWYVVFVGLE